MANEVRIQGSATGNTTYFEISNPSTGLSLNRLSFVFGTPGFANWSNYCWPATERGNIAVWYGNMPGNIAANFLRTDYYEQANNTGNVAQANITGDLWIGYDERTWDGSKWMGLGNVSSGGGGNVNVVTWRGNTPANLDAAGFVMANVAAGSLSANATGAPFMTLVMGGPLRPGDVCYGTATVSDGNGSAANLDGNLTVYLQRNGANVGVPVNVEANHPTGLHPFNFSVPLTFNPGDTVAAFGNGEVGNRSLRTVGAITLVNAGVVLVQANTTLANFDFPLDRANLTVAQYKVVDGGNLTLANQTVSAIGGNGSKWYRSNIVVPDCRFLGVEFRANGSSGAYFQFIVRP